MREVYDPPPTLTGAGLFLKEEGMFTLIVFVHRAANRPSERGPQTT
jgi:hypothetical protein